MTQFRVEMSDIKDLVESGEKWNEEAEAAVEAENKKIRKENYEFKEQLSDKVVAEFLEYWDRKWLKRERYSKSYFNLLFKRDTSELSFHHVWSGYIRYLHNNIYSLGEIYDSIYSEINMNGNLGSFFPYLNITLWRNILDTCKTQEYALLIEPQLIDFCSLQEKVKKPIEIKYYRGRKSITPKWLEHSSILGRARDKANRIIYEKNS